jgi:hypothetical protein
MCVCVCVRERERERERPRGELVSVSQFYLKVLPASQTLVWKDGE